MSSGRFDGDGPKVVAWVVALTAAYLLWLGIKSYSDSVVAHYAGIAVGSTVALAILRVWHLWTRS